MREQSARAKRFLDWFDNQGVSVEPETAAQSAVDGAPMHAVLKRRRSREKYHVVYLPAMTLTEANALSLGGRPSRPLLIIGDHISDRSAAAYRNAGIQYLDAAGNAHVAFGDVLIDIQGRQGVRGISGSVPERETNLFSARRSQVIFALLAWPELLASPLREISRTSKVSIGQVQSTMKLLEKTSYLHGGTSRSLQRKGELLDRWVAAYPTGLLPTLRLRDFSGDIRSIKRAEGDASLFVSGEFAVPEVLQPETITLYTDDINPRLLAANRWRADGPKNIFLRRKFWEQPEIDRTGRERRGDDLREIERVPALLMYADLLSTGDSRQSEAAAHLREQHVGLHAM